ncbi:PAS domain S-box protein [Mangrovibacterium lignilyticum]|uniref:PAS domain S-box protein n=1 Tax=Mangrovibacterium lignilyticum TaxID=2668052 RepID=UPI0013D23160|nr:PAS domain S-box protein [Mangrovibacterium lignilyticum]
MFKLFSRIFGADSRKHKDVNSTDAMAALKNSLLENSLVGMYIIQNDSFKYVNPRFCEIFGYSYNEIVEGMGPGDMVFEEDRALVRQNVKKRINGDTDSLEYEFRGVKKDGSIIHVRVLGSLTKYRNKPAISGTLIDITHHFRLQEELRASEERLRVALETTQTGIWDWDVVNDVWFATPIFFTMLGYEPGNGNLDRSVWLNRIHPEDRLVFLKQIDRILTGKCGEYAYDARMLHADGSYRWHQVIGSAVRSGKNGTVKRMVGIRRDITAAKQAEENIRKQEGRLRALIDAIPDLVWLKDAQGVFLQCNDRLAELLGVDKRQIIGKTDYDFFSKGLADHFNLKDQAAMKKNDPYVYEEEVVFADGHREMLETIKTPIYEYDGDLIGILGIGRNISQRKELEVSLRKSEEKYRYIFEKAPVGIFKIALTGEFQIFNKTLLDQFECQTDDEFVRYYKNVADFWLEGSDRENFLRLLKDKGQVMAYEFEARLISGKIKWFSIYVQLDERDSTYEGFCVDISQSKQNQAELIAAKEKAEESERLKSAFLMNMSHEVRTPMNSILGFLEMFEDEEFDGAKDKRFFEVVNLSARRLMDTITNILEISKIEAGENRLIIRSVCLEDEFRFLFDFFESQAEAKGLKLTCDIPDEDAETWIETDQYKLETILMNLLKNAVKFTAEGTIEFGYTIDEDSLCCFVKDSGCGIYPEKMNAIFDRFVQADMNLTRRKEGSGLGLSISKAYAMALDGEIDVESVIGRGSRFEFRMTI